MALNRVVPEATFTKGFTVSCQHCLDVTTKAAFGAPGQGKIALPSGRQLHTA
jgi:hypothetical protein